MKFQLSSSIKKTSNESWQSFIGLAMFSEFWYLSFSNQSISWIYWPLIYSKAQGYFFSYPCGINTHVRFECEEIMKNKSVMWKILEFYDASANKTSEPRMLNITISQHFDSLRLLSEWFNIDLMTSIFNTEVMKSWV